MTPPAPSDLGPLLDRYGVAWNSHDLDAIMALHTEDCVYALHAGAEPAVGSAAVRASFAAALDQWPDIHFAPQQLLFGAEHVTARWAVTATPTGRPLQFDAVDVLLWRDGKIARKDTYIDAIAVQTQLADDRSGAA